MLRKEPCVSGFLECSGGCSQEGDELFGLSGSQCDRGGVRGVNHEGIGGEVMVDMDTRN